MGPRDDEEQLLRDVALQNAVAIGLARQRAEEELILAKEALELKTRELARSVAMLRATLESATDGIVVTDSAGMVTGFNEKFVDMWHLAGESLDGSDHRDLLRVISGKFEDPEAFVARVDALYATSPAESYDLLELADGRVFERFSRIQFVNEENIGRVWSFRDITDRRDAEDTLKHQTEWLKTTLGSIGDGVVATDTEGRVTFVNGVAEALTGWPELEALGQPLARIFRIVSAETRQPADSPVALALRENQIVALADDTILIARDGSETPID
ncbi:MAG: PAS domain S-box protein, partial [Gemmatimonadota bacterium]